MVGKYEPALGDSFGVEVGCDVEDVVRTIAATNEIERRVAMPEQEFDDSGQGRSGVEVKLNGLKW